MPADKPTSRNRHFNLVAMVFTCRILNHSITKQSTPDHCVTVLGILSRWKDFVCKCQNAAVLFTCSISLVTWIRSLVSVFRLWSVSGLTLHLQTCRRVASTKSCLHMLRQSIATYKTGLLHGLEDVNCSPAESNRWNLWKQTYIDCYCNCLRDLMIRLFARKIPPAPFRWDDWTIIIAFIWNFGSAIC